MGYTHTMATFVRVFLSPLVWIPPHTKVERRHGLHAHRGNLCVGIHAFCFPAGTERHRGIHARYGNPGGYLLVCSKQPVGKSERVWRNSDKRVGIGYQFFNSMAVDFQYSVSIGKGHGYW